MLKQMSQQIDIQSGRNSATAYPLSKSLRERDIVYRSAHVRGGKVFSFKATSSDMNLTVPGKLFETQEL